MSDLDYAAGLFDGEGSITLGSRKGLPAKRLVLSMASTDRGLVDFMAGLFGGKTYDIGKRSLRQKPIFHWIAEGTLAVKILTELTPFLREKRKRARAEIVLSDLAPVMGDHSRDPVIRARRIRAQELILSI